MHATPHWNGCCEARLLVALIGLQAVHLACKRLLHADPSERPIDTYKETASNRIAIKWKCDLDVETWFESRGIGLKWVYDLDDDYSVYQASSIAAANQFMKVILEILKGAGGHAQGSHSALRLATATGHVLIMAVCKPHSHLLSCGRHMHHLRRQVSPQNSAE